MRVNAVVEGQSEETFVRDVLAPGLGQAGVYIAARSVETSRDKRQIFRGGLVNYPKAKRDIQLWLKQDSEAIVTTMFDLYRLPPTFPGKGKAAAIADPHIRIDVLEKAFAADIGSERFIPYIQLHEFEGLLFSDPQEIDYMLGSPHVSRLKTLQAIVAGAHCPECINDGDETAPSKRLIQIFPGYDKVAYGPLIAEAIGLQVLRDHCEHFSGWIQRLVDTA